jgi:hypothetical protein
MTAPSAHFQNEVGSYPLSGRPWKCELDGPQLASAEKVVACGQIAASLIGASSQMSKLLLAAFNTCLWITLLALVITGVIRVGVEAMERRVQHQATLHSAQSSTSNR